MLAIEVVSVARYCPLSNVRRAYPHLTLIICLSFASMSNTQEPLDTSALFGATGMLGGTILEAVLEDAIQSFKPIIRVCLR